MFFSLMRSVLLHIGPPVSITVLKTHEFTTVLNRSIEIPECEIQLNVKLFLGTP
jgi:hypothetical protein